MFDIVILDSGPLSVATTPRNEGDPPRVRAWLHGLWVAGMRVVIPEIADYEVRRELLRAGKMRGIARLDELGRLFDYLPLSTSALRQAAEFWAEARKSGRPTAAREALDGDVILAAQALQAAGPGQTFVVATTNVGHIARYVRAMAWNEIH